MSFIHPRDFFTTAADCSANDWHRGAGQGAMRHIIKALEGKRIWLETDKRTGYGCEVEVIGRARVGGCYNTPAILVRHHHEDGGSHQTAHRLMNVGAIVQIDAPRIGRGAKLEALDSIRKEHAAARELFYEAHPESRNDGGIVCYSMFDEGCVYVSWTPSNAGPGNRGIHEVVTVAPEPIAA